jgi:arylsulfatase A-like enzyme
MRAIVLREKGRKSYSLPDVRPVEAWGKVRLTLDAKAGAPEEVRLFAKKLAVSERISRGPYRVPKRAMLEFGIAATNDGWYADPPDVIFRIYASIHQQKGDPELLFEHTLNPTRRESGGRWINQRLDLDHLARKDVTFTFETAIDSEEPVAVYPLWSNPTLYKPGRLKNSRNFILISLDTLRAKELGTYGYPLNTSPFIDELAKGPAVVFENALTTSSSTPQAHMSMFTGLYPSVHGITKGLQPLSQEMVTVTEALREAGYETGAITEDGWLATLFGFNRGMNSYRENKSASIWKPSGQVDRTVDEALKWLERHSSKKFFLFLHTYQVHEPYAPPPDYQNLFSPYRHEGKTYATEKDLPDNLKAMRDYDREVRYVDDELRRLFEGLLELGLNSSTVVLITSDHGEEFLEHGHYGHGAHLYDNEILRVPLIVWGPGVVRGPRRVPTLVSIVDLMPTLLELGGVPIPSGLQGVSLARTLKEKGALPPGNRMVFAEAWAKLTTVGAARITFPWKRPAFAVRNERFKYIINDAYNPDGARLELYDIVKDLGERENLLKIAPDAWPSGRHEILTYALKSAKTRESLLAGIAPEKDRPDVLIDPRREEKLRALGYVQ